MAANSAPTLPPAPKRAAPTPNARPDAHVRRFLDDVARLIGADTGQRFGVAVSGGPDSVALLLLAQAAFPGRVLAATVDHGLRVGSTNEAQFVAELCVAQGIAHETLTLGPLPDGNVSAMARAARYAALAAWRDRNRIDWIMTGHHADDQAETIIMRLNRGAGVAGLSGVRSKQGHVLRPLLHWRRSELAEIVAMAGITPVDDPTNRDDAYDRARLRKSLAGADWIDPLATANSADAMADADAAIEWAVDGLARAHIRHDGTTVIFDRTATDAPAEIIRRLTLRCLNIIDPGCSPRGPALTRFIGGLESGAAVTLGNVAAKCRKNWVFALAPPHLNVG